MLYEPYTINEIIKYFRNTKSTRVKDIESLRLELMNEDEFGQDVNES